MLNFIIRELDEFERLGVIVRLDEQNNILYLIIPRDLSKDNIKDNIERIKNLGIRVFSKVKGINEYYNVYGQLLDRNRPLEDYELLDCARDTLGKIKIEDSVEKMMTIHNAEVFRCLSEKVTKEELEKVQEHITFLRMLSGVGL